jgi:hypothetical protein
MAEPLKHPMSRGDGAPADGAPRTARARSERDLGRSSKRRERRPEPRADARPRNGGTSSRSAGARSGSPQRPRGVKAGNGARLLAPLALIVFAIACFIVLSSQQSSGTADTSTTSTKAAATTAAAKTVGPTRSKYTVKPGDSFAAIAEKQGVEVQTLQELNPDIDPRALQPGQKLKLK